MATVILAEPEASAPWVRTREFEAADFTLVPAVNGADLARALAQVAPEALVVDRRLAGPTGECVRRLPRTPGGGAPGATSWPCCPARPSASSSWRRGPTGTSTRPRSSARSRAPSAPTCTRPPPRPDAPPRLTPRAPLALPIEYYTHGRSLGAGESRDLSLVGMFVKTPDPAAAGDLVLLGFTVPGARRWDCFRRVLWTRQAGDPQPFPLGMGVELVDLQPEAMATLASPA